MLDDEGDKIRTWEAQLKATTRVQINKFGLTDVAEEQIETIPSTNVIDPVAATVIDMHSRVEQTSTDCDAQGRTELARLNEDQRRAHDIIEERLKEHMTSE